MAEKKYQVFISSTYADLKEERRKILDVLLMADCIPAGMEAFVASDMEQFEVIKKVIELCDYYILIIGRRYGSINKQTGISYTEMEYEYAKELGIPVLVFALDESAKVSEDKVEKDPQKIAALERFRKKALTNRLATIWKTQDELTGAVAVSIMRATKQIQRPGWQRATDYDEASLRREIMELQQEKNRLIDELKDARNELSAINSIDNVAFEDYELTIEYIKTKTTNTGASRTTGSVKVTLTRLFEIISTEMIDVAVSEGVVESCIRANVFPDRYATYTLSDPQMVKKILNQLKAKHLLYSKWSSKDNTLFWGVTPKGRIERDKRIVVRSS